MAFFDTMHARDLDPYDFTKQQVRQGGLFEIFKALSPGHFRGGIAASLPKRGPTVDPHDVGKVGAAVSKALNQPGSFMGKSAQASEQTVEKLELLNKLSAETEQFVERDFRVNKQTLAVTAGHFKRVEKNIEEESADRRAYKKTGYFSRKDTHMWRQAVLDALKNMGRLGRDTQKITEDLSDATQKTQSRVEMMMRKAFEKMDRIPRMIREQKRRFEDPKYDEEVRQQRRQRRQQRMAQLFPISEDNPHFETIQKKGQRTYKFSQLRKRVEQTRKTQEERTKRRTARREKLIRSVEDAYDKMIGSGSSHAAKFKRQQSKHHAYLVRQLLRFGYKREEASYHASDILNSRGVLSLANYTQKHQDTRSRFRRMLGRFSPSDILLRGGFDRQAHIQQRQAQGLTGGGLGGAALSLGAGALGLGRLGVSSLKGLGRGALNVGRGVGTFARFGGRFLPGAMAAVQGARAVSHFNQGDYFGGTVAGLSGAASLIPGLGPFVGMALEGLGSMVPEEYKKWFNEKGSELWTNMFKPALTTLTTMVFGKEGMGHISGIFKTIGTQLGDIGEIFENTWVALQPLLKFGWNILKETLSSAFPLFKGAVEIVGVGLKGLRELTGFFADIAQGKSVGEAFTTRFTKAWGDLGEWWARWMQQELPAVILKSVTGMDNTRSKWDKKEELERANARLRSLGKREIPVSAIESYNLSVEDIKQIGAEAFTTRRHSSGQRAGSGKTTVVERLREIQGPPLPPTSDFFGPEITGTSRSQTEKTEKEKSKPSFWKKLWKFIGPAEASASEMPMQYKAPETQFHLTSSTPTVSTTGATVSTTAQTTSTMTVSTETRAKTSSQGPVSVENLLAVPAGISATAAQQSKKLFEAELLKQANQQAASVTPIVPSGNIPGWTPRMSPSAGIPGVSAPLQGPLSPNVGAGGTYRDTGRRVGSGLGAPSPQVITSQTPLPLTGNVETDKFLRIARTSTITESGGKIDAINPTTAGNMLGAFGKYQFAQRGGKNPLNVAGDFVKWMQQSNDPDMQKIGNKLAEAGPIAQTGQFAETWRSIAKDPTLKAKFETGQDLYAKKMYYDPLQAAGVGKLSEAAQGAAFASSIHMGAPTAARVLRENQGKSEHEIVSALYNTRISRISHAGETENVLRERQRVLAQMATGSTAVAQVAPTIANGAAAQATVHAAVANMQTQQQQTAQQLQNATGAVTSQVAAGQEETLRQLSENARQMANAANNNKQSIAPPDDLMVRLATAMVF